METQSQQSEKLRKQIKNKFDELGACPSPIKYANLL